MGLTHQMLQAIKDEITNDPAGRGYYGKTPVEIASLLNDPYEIERTVSQFAPARLSQILEDIASTPNAIDSSDVIQSQLI